MSEYSELFPNGYPELQGPFEPPDMSAFPHQAGAKARQALQVSPAGGLTGTTPSGADPVTELSAYLDDRFSGLTPPPPSGTGGFGTSFRAGISDVGAMAAGAGEYLARQAETAGETPLQQGINSAVTPVRETLEGWRKGATESAERIASTMSPLAQDEATRQWLSLDPDKTIWKGGVGEFMSSVGLKLTRSAPSSLVTIVPASILMRVGVVPGAIKYLAGTEGALSMGGIANGIAQEIENAPEEELLQSTEYQKLRAVMDEAQAREQFTGVAQGLTPAIGGVLVGAISAAAGRYFAPTITDDMSLLARAGRGAVAEGPLEEGPQSVVEQVLQNHARQIFDKEQSLLEGVGEQAVEGTVIGGITGGGISSVVGHGPRAAIPPPSSDQQPPTSAPPIGIEPGAPPGAPTNDQGYEEYLQPGDQASLPLGIPRDELVPTQPSVTPRFRSGRQGITISLSSVPDDVALALTSDRELARGEEQRPDGTRAPTGELPYGPEFAQRQAAIPMAWNDRQQQPEPPTDIPYDQSLVVPPGTGRQVPLPLRDRQMRGVGQPQTLGQPLQEDLSQPEGTYRDVNRPYEPGAPTPIEPLPTGPVARGLKGKARQKELAAALANRQATAGTLPPYEEPQGTTERLPLDETQQDLFDAAPEATGEPRPEAQGRQITGYEVSVKDKQTGDMIGTEVFNSEEGKLADGFAFEIAKMYPGARVDSLPIYSGRRVTAGEREENPSAEPVGDLLAQVEDLRDPDSPREGVYLSKSNLENLTANGALDRIRSAGPTLTNFDDKGGTVVAKNREIADRLLADKAEGYEMQDLLGSITGAGSGKPTPSPTTVAVQQRDEDGNVTRESLVATEEEAEALSAKWEALDPGRETVILRPNVALSRRERKIAQENKRLSGEKEASAATYTAERAIEKGLPEGETREKATEVTRGVRTKQEAAAKLAKLATEEFARTKVGASGLPRPEDIEFQVGKDGNDRGPRYKELYNKYVLSKADADFDRAAAYVRIHPTRKLNVAESVMAVATKVSKKGVEKLARVDEDEPGRVYINEPGSITSGEPGSGSDEAVEQESETPVAETEDVVTRLSETPRGKTYKTAQQEAPNIQLGFEAISPTEVDALNEDDLNVAFLKAAYFSAGRAFRKAVGDIDADPTYITDETKALAEDMGFVVDEDGVASYGDQLDDYSWVKEKHKELDQWLKANKAGKKTLGFRERRSLFWMLDYLVEESDMDPNTSFQQILDINKSPSLKRKFVKRVSFTIERSKYGGKPSATEREPNREAESAKRARASSMFTLGAKESKEGRDFVRRTEGAYTGELTHGFPSNTEMEESAAKRAAFDKRATEVYDGLGVEIEKVQTFLEELPTAPGYVEVMQDRDENGDLTDDARDMIYAKQYLKALTQYSFALKTANYRAAKAVRQAEVLTAKMAKLRGYNPVEFANKAGLLMRAEAAEQALIAVNSPGMGLVGSKALRTKAGRLKTILDQTNDIRQEMARSLALERAWKDSADFRRNIGPFLRMFGESIALRFRGDFAESVAAPKYLYEPDAMAIGLMKSAYNRLLRGTETRHTETRAALTAALLDSNFTLPSRDTDVRVHNDSKTDKASDFWSTAKILRLVNSLMNAGTRNKTVIPEAMHQTAKDLGLRVTGGVIVSTPEFEARFNNNIKALNKTRATRAAKNRDYKAKPTAARKALHDAAVAAHSNERAELLSRIATVATEVVRGRLAANKQLRQMLRRSLAEVGVTFDKETGEATGWEKFNYGSNTSARSDEDAPTVGDEDAIRAPEFARGKVSTAEVNRIIERDRKAREEAANTESFTKAGQARLGPSLAAQGYVDKLRSILNDPEATALDIINAEEAMLERLKLTGVWKSSGSTQVMGRIIAPGASDSGTIRLLAPRLKSGRINLKEARALGLDMYEPITFQEDVSALPAVKEARTKTMRKVSRKVAEAKSSEGPQGLGWVDAERLKKLRRSLRYERSKNRHDMIGKQASKSAYSAAAIPISTSLDNDMALERRGQDRFGIDVTELLNQVAEKLPSTTHWGKLARQLASLNMNARVHYEIIDTPDSRGTAIKDEDGAYKIYINREHFSEMYTYGLDVGQELVHTLLHEAVHVATMQNIDSNAQLRAAATTTWRQAKAVWMQAHNDGRYEEVPYGFKDVHEFVAEGFSNTDFQMTLMEIEYGSTNSWTEFLKIIFQALKNLLGGNFSLPTNALDALMSMEPYLFAPVTQNQNTGPAARHDMVAPLIEDGLRRLDQSRVMRDNLSEANYTMKAVGGKFLLSAMTMEQLKTFFVKHFNDPANPGKNPLSNYIETFFRRGAAQSAMLEEGDRKSREWTKLEEKDSRQSDELSRLMTEATLNDMHIDVPLTHESNEHITNDRAKGRHATLSRRFNSLGKEWKKQYVSVRDYYAATVKHEVSQMTLNMLRAELTRGQYATMTEEEFSKYTDDSVETLKLSTIKGMEAEFGDKLSKTSRQIVSRAAAISQKRQGPYFPINRNGDFVVYAEMEGETKFFSDYKEAQAYKQDLEAEDPTLDVSLKKTEDETQWSVATKEIEFRMAESRTEAEQNRREMVAKFGSEATTPVQLRAALFKGESSIASNTALSSILKKLEGNRAAQAAVKNFYLQSLADSSFRKREANRKNRAGFTYERQHRNFGIYSKQSSYYIAQLEYGWKMGSALQEMQETVGKHRDESKISSVRMGYIVQEINNRDKLSTDPEQVSKLVKKGVELSHFMLLSTPSYWLINATQPYTVAMPWLAARHSWAKAATALANAQKLIADPLLSEMGESKLGAKALFSKSAAEKAFTVIEQVEAHIKARGGVRSADYLTMLTELKRNSIIDLSFVAELRDIADGTASTWTHRVLDASRIMAHLTEVNNRIVVALASYDLARDAGTNHAEATSFARDAVSTTQFNYSSGNKPPLFQTKGLFGKLSPLAFQFLQYPQHMYAMLVREFLTVVQDGGVPRKVALKTLAGVFGTHLIAGGIIGVSLQPIKWAIGLALAAFNDDVDRPEDVISGELYDQWIREMSAEVLGVDFGRLASKGLPAALGTDLSLRMALGQMYNFNLKTDTPEDFLGSMVTNFGGPTIGLGVSAARSLGHFREGRMLKALEGVLPKFMKDAVKLYRYSEEGLKGNSGNTILDASQMTPGDLFLQSIGFQPTRINEAYDRQHIINVRKQALGEQRSFLIRKFKNAEDKTAAWADINEFSRQNPENPITRSDVVRTLQKQAMSNVRTKAYGADIAKPTQEDFRRMAPYQMTSSETGLSQGFSLQGAGSASYQPKAENISAFKPQVVAAQRADYSYSGSGPLANLFSAVEHVESRGNPFAVSPAGALGPMQTMPGTLKDPGYGIAPARNNSPEEQRRVGREYLSAMIDKYGGNLDHALTAYNWGPGNTDKWLSRGADPSKLPLETRKYIPSVRERL